MEKIKDFLKRHSIWLIISLTAILLIEPAIAEIKTLFLIIAAECIAIALSGVSVYVYTHIDFTKEPMGNNLGLIFLGVHICVGLVVLGVYIAQFSS